MGLIRVSADSHSTPIARYIADRVRDHEAVEVQAISAVAVNQAVKATALARTYLQKTPRRSRSPVCQDGAAGDRRQEGGDPLDDRADRSGQAAIRPWQAGRAPPSGPTFPTAARSASLSAGTHSTPAVPAPSRSPPRLTVVPSSFRRRRQS